MAGGQDDLFNMRAKPSKLSIWKNQRFSFIDQVFWGCTEGGAKSDNRMSVENKIFVVSIWLASGQPVRVPLVSFFFRKVSLV